MFTGLIEATATLESLETDSGRTTLSLATDLIDKLAIGDSIAINGVCLTAAAFDSNTVQFHLLNQTLHCTNLGALKVGDRVNVERPMIFGERLHGHLVSGHIDSTSSVLSIGEDGADHIVEIELPENLAALAVEKGSVAVDGISLTIAALDRDAFRVCITPYTWTHTNMCGYARGCIVNLEMDMVGKYVMRRNDLESQP
ncbi:MAG: riboflavin synthase [Lentisphaeria bacterium]|jgi:riboflavin synthase|nr:riboflavin synthase [Lentisphaeria bacterium]